MLATGVMALFFTAMAMLPLQTLGEPAFDTTMIRVRCWGGVEVFRRVICRRHLLAAAGPDCEALGGGAMGARGQGLRSMPEKACHSAPLMVRYGKRTLA
jgi:hypothetical protein